MTGIPSLPTGLNMWKIGAIIAAIITLIIGGLAVKTQIENRQLDKQRVELQKSINDPVTGYVARLTTAQNSVITLKAAVQKQNTEFIRQSNAAKAELARLKRELSVAQAQTKVYQRRVNELLNKPIEGRTPQERYDSVDKLILEDLAK
jgi:hypothetical protein